MFKPLNLHAFVRFTRREQAVDLRQPGAEEKREMGGDVYAVSARPLLMASSTFLRASSARRSASSLAFASRRCASCSWLASLADSVPAGVPLGPCGDVSGSGRTKSSCDGQVIAGDLPCTAAIMRCNQHGSSLETFCWRLRNPYGLSFDRNGRLLAIDLGINDRGSRPVGNVPDCLFAAHTIYLPSRCSRSKNSDGIAIVQIVVDFTQLLQNRWK